jgi:hypothetical protein
MRKNRQVELGGSHGRLTIGTSEWRLDRDVAANLLGVFRDDMYRRRVIPAREYYPALADTERGDRPMEVFVAPGPARRLRP